MADWQGRESGWIVPGIECGWVVIKITGGVGAPRSAPWRSAAPGITIEFLKELLLLLINILMITLDHTSAV